MIRKFNSSCLSFNQIPTALKTVSVHRIPCHTANSQDAYQFSVCNSEGSIISLSALLWSIATFSWSMDFGHYVFTFDMFTVHGFPLQVPIHFENIIVVNSTGVSIGSERNFCQANCHRSTLCVIKTTSEIIGVYRIMFQNLLPALQPIEFCSALWLTVSQGQLLSTWKGEMHEQYMK